MTLIRLTKAQSLEQLSFGLALRQRTNPRSHMKQFSSASQLVGQCLYWLFAELTGGI